MDECLDALAAFTSKFRELLSKREGGKEKVMEIRRQFEALAEQVLIDSASFTDSGDRVTKKQSLFPSQKIHFMNVLTPRWNQYDYESEGVSAVGHRVVGRISSSSLVRTPGISKYYNSLHYTSDPSSTVEICHENDLDLDHQRESPTSSLEVYSSFVTKSGSTGQQETRVEHIYGVREDSSNGSTVVDSKNTKALLVEGEELVGSANDAGSISRSSGQFDNVQPDASDVIRSTSPSILRGISIVSGIPVINREGEGLEGGTSILLAHEAALSDEISSKPVANKPSDDISNTCSTRSNSPSLLEPTVAIMQNDTLFAGEIENAGTEKAQKLSGGYFNDNDGSSSSMEFAKIGVYNMMGTSQTDEILNVSPSIESTNTAKAEFDDSCRIKDTPLETTSSSNAQFKSWSHFEDYCVCNTEQESCDEFFEVTSEDIGNVRTCTTYNSQPKLPRTSKRRPLSRKRTRRDRSSDYMCCGCGQMLCQGMDAIHFNEQLNVIVCERCFKMLTGGDFLKDTEGHEVYCTMCGEGGSLVLCSSCYKSVCQDCLERFVGNEKLQEVLGDEDEEWYCFCCNPAPISKYQEICKQYQLMNGIGTSKNPSPPCFLNATNVLENSLSVDQNRLDKSETAGANNQDRSQNVSTSDDCETDFGHGNQDKNGSVSLEINESKVSDCYIVKSDDEGVSLPFSHDSTDNSVAEHNQYFLPEPLSSNKAQKATDGSREDVPLSYSCCGCGKALDKNADEICFNDRLKVIVCEVCRKRLTVGEFSMDTEGHEVYCSMCGDGGSLVLCDSCEKSVCQGCLKRVVGNEKLNCIIGNKDQEEWYCFSCDPTPIQRQQEKCKQYHLMGLITRSNIDASVESIHGPSPCSSLPILQVPSNVLIHDNHQTIEKNEFPGSERYERARGEDSNETHITSAGYDCSASPDSWNQDKDEIGSFKIIGEEASQEVSSYFEPKSSTELSSVSVSDDNCLEHVGEHRQPFSLTPLSSRRGPREGSSPFYSCCICKRTLYRNVDICINRRLSVIICKICNEKLKDEDFLMDTEGQEVFCSMCGDGGYLVLCDGCEKSVCQDCLRQFIGDEKLRDIIEKDVKWKCFCCDPTPIEGQQRVCRQFCQLNNIPIQLNCVSFGQNGVGSSTSKNETNGGQYIQNHYESELDKKQHGEKGGSCHQQQSETENNHLLMTTPSSSRGPLEDTSLKYYCCGCGNTLYKSVDMICFNESLHVIVCQKCFKNLRKAEEQDEIHCTMCGRRGKDLLICGKCGKSVCQGCLMRFIGEENLQKVLNHRPNFEWWCFSCNPTPIYDQQVTYEQYQMIKALEDSTRRKKTSNETTNTISQNRKRNRSLMDEPPVKRRLFEDSDFEMS